MRLIPQQKRDYVNNCAKRSNTIVLSFSSAPGDTVVLTGYFTGKDEECLCVGGERVFADQVLLFCASV